MSTHTLNRPEIIPALDGADPMIVVESLTKTYRGRPALDGLTLEVPPERIIGLMGSNGSGKTTLLKILAGVLADYDGRVRIAGHHPGPESKTLVSFLPDASFLAPGLTVPPTSGRRARAPLQPARRTYLEGEEQGYWGEAACKIGHVAPRPRLPPRRADLRCRSRRP